MTDVENLPPVEGEAPFEEPKTRRKRTVKPKAPEPERSFSAVDVAEYLWKLNDQDEFCSERFEGDPNYTYTVNVGIGPVPGALEVQTTAWSNETGEAHEASSKKFVMFIREL